MIAGILTGQTCAANCWYAREPECRCSCSGANHGCLLVDGAEQPRRNCTIQGARYVLATIGGWGEIAPRERAFLASLDREVYGREYRRYDGTTTRLAVVTNEKGAVVWTKRASKDQCSKWGEITTWAASQPRAWRPYLLWVREDLAQQFDALEG